MDGGERSRSMQVGVLGVWELEGLLIRRSGIGYEGHAWLDCGESVELRQKINGVCIALGIRHVLWSFIQHSLPLYVSCTN